MSYQHYNGQQQYHQQQPEPNALNTEMQNLQVPCQQEPPLASRKRTARAYHAIDTAEAPVTSAPHELAPPPPPPHHHQQQQHHPQGNIAQPVHSQGQQLPANKTKLDVDAIPSPVSVHWRDQQRVDTEQQGSYLSCARAQVPLSMVDYVGIDQGNSIPRYMRMTTYTLPHSDDLALASHIPLGLIVQPFADVQPGEQPVPLADFSEHGPPRCAHCRGYINPWCRFQDGGQRFVCNLCGGITDVPQEYFCHLDMSGRRMDFEQRPELAFGSVDFLVPKDYWVQPSPAEMAAFAASPQASTSKDAQLQPRTPEPIKFVFAIDVSFTAGKTYMIQQAVQAIRTALYPEALANPHENGDTNGVTPFDSGLPHGSKIAILTFDTTVHFYNLSADLEQPQMMVVPDLDDMFLPIYEGLLVDPKESRSVVEQLLAHIETTFADNMIVEASLGAATKASLEILKRFGGQINLFQSCLPTIGPGSLRHREDQKMYGTDKERTLFTAQDPMYRQLGEECADAGVGVNLFLFPSQYIDVASIGVLAGLTGGEVFFHPRFDPTRERHKLASELRGALSREMGYSVTMRIRCSEGLRVSDHFGNFFQRNVTDLEFGTLDADKAVVALIKHDSRLDEKMPAYFQCAVLYTSASGQRRVRCHNLAVAVSSKLGDVFRTADMDATITLAAKEAISQTLAKGLREVRDALTDQCVKVLLAYRKHCASATSAGQLILPESFKLYPLYALSVIKTKALKGGPVASDVRTYYMRMIKSFSVFSTIELLYPRFFPLHNLLPEDCQRSAEGRFQMPPQLRLSYQRMESHGAYLVENGETAILWLGASVSPALLQDLYGIDDLKDIDTRMTQFPNLPTLLSQQVRSLLEELNRQQRHRSLHVLIARQGVDGTEMEFANMLIEDPNNDALSYADYLCVCHKQIQSALVGEKKEAEAENNAMWRNVW